MFWMESTRFKCPICGNKVDVAAQGQGFIERMENPTPVHCSECGAELILNPRTLLFRLGVLLLSLGGPLLYFWLELGTASFIVSLVGGVILVFSLLSNRLVTNLA